MPSAMRRALPLIEYTPDLAVRIGSAEGSIPATLGIGSKIIAFSREGGSSSGARSSRLNIPSSTTLLSPGQITVQSSVTSPSSATCPWRRRTTAPFLQRPRELSEQEIWPFLRQLIIAQVVYPGLRHPAIPNGSSLPFSIDELKRIYGVKSLMRKVLGDAPVFLHKSGSRGMARYVRINRAVPEGLEEGQYFFACGSREESGGMRDDIRMHGLRCLFQNESYG